ncbi:MAG TPA: fasciclin domain-containing protein [Baekduia sp.]|uniref:fasciclin domain-containing protein n=1 Tax=Baekduia sp. TaxID=2600305 RepID=UPI002CFE1E25|nr:fasciclin domain-containing protein [Baekduia sp.]HMJ37464.1 fasciclin domain-containing protein [Baekduia sp.]
MQRKLLVAGVAATALAVPVATSSPAAPPAPATAAQSATIPEVAQSAGQFKTLLKLVKSAGLASTLSQGSYTVFAPTDAAFAKVPKKTLTALGKDKAMLKSVLLYHVLDGRVPASSVVRLTSAKTLNGAPVKIRVRGGKVYLNGSTRVTRTDVQASNGIIHVINKVLMPPS